jgi:predicted small integral membrane protein
MLAIRAAKIVLVAAVALHASLVAFGNVTDYGTNWLFVQHVLSMDTIFPTATIRYRAIAGPLLQQAAYLLIIATEIAVAALCWIGAWRLFANRRAGAVDFNRAKTFAVCGLVLALLLWQVGFITIAGEWFGMWMSSTWNGVPSAFRLVVILLGTLIFVALPDDDIDKAAH